MLQTLFLIILNISSFAQGAAPQCVDLFSSDPLNTFADDFNEYIKYGSKDTPTYVKTHVQLASHIDADFVTTKKVWSQYADLGQNSIQRYYWIEHVGKEGLLPLNEIFYNSRIIGFSPDGKEIRIIDSGSKSLYDNSNPRDLVLSTETGELIRELPSFSEYKRAKAFLVSRDFKTGVVVNPEILQIFDISHRTPRPIFNVKGETGVLSPDGQFVIAKNDNRLHLYRINQNSVTLVLNTKWVSRHFRETFSPDGRYVALREGLTTVGIYSTTTGQRVSGFTMVRGYSLKFSPNGEYLLLLKDNKIIVRSVVSGELLLDINLSRALQSNIYDLGLYMDRVHFSKDSQRVGISGIVSEMLIYNIIVDIPTGNIEVI